MLRSGKLKQSTTEASCLQHHMPEAVKAALSTVAAGLASWSSKLPNFSALPVQRCAAEPARCYCSMRSAG